MKLTAGATRVCILGLSRYITKTSRRDDECSHDFSIKTWLFFLKDCYGSLNDCPTLWKVGRSITFPQTLWSSCRVQRSGSKSVSEPLWKELCVKLAAAREQTDKRSKLNETTPGGLIWSCSLWPIHSWGWFDTETSAWGGQTHMDSE